MASRTRGTVQVRGKSISVVLDLGEQPWRGCPTPRCDGSVFTDKTVEMACERCGEPLAAPIPHRRRAWHSGFKTKGEANRAMTVMLGQVDTGSFAAPSTLTVRQFVTEMWLPGLKLEDLRASTISMYERSAKTYVLPHLGSLRLRDVTPTHLKAWLNTLKSAGVGDRTIEIAGVTVHKILKGALNLEIVARNAADNDAVRDARPRPKAEPPRVWTRDELRAFLDSQRQDRLFALWRVVAMSGIRRGELCGLTWPDVMPLEGATLKVSRTRVVVDYKVVESEPKTDASRRNIRLDPVTVAALRAHRASQAGERLAAGELWQGSDYVFCDELGRPYHPDRLTRTLAAKAKAAGLPPIKFHALRHGHATAALENGISLKVISERLGHSSIQITGDIYSHVTPAVDEAAAVAIAAAIDG
ncbi:MAG: tyrosine-type recombinase/integrase [Acidimicrobiales bacterium]